MPELAEVEFFRKEWDPGLDHVVAAVAVHERSRVFRQCDSASLRKNMAGARFIASEAHGKKLLFRFRHERKGLLLWLGLHLGMTGKLGRASAEHKAKKHDHLVLYLNEFRQGGAPDSGGCALVFSDPRQFGRIEFATGHEAPPWWQGLPPPILSSNFTKERMEGFLTRRRRTSIKAVLLMQDAFPGLGNWMADEILWRAGIHPARPAGELSVAERKTLFRAVRFVCRTAINTVGRDFRDPPPGWLFHQRWKKGGICPRTGEPLRYDQVAGRTSCWSPARQR